MHAREFVKLLDRRVIPSEPPDVQLYFEQYDGEYVNYRTECCQRGMWALVYKSWVEVLADWINSHKVLEIMAGRGWLAKALSECGVDMIATDDQSWNESYSKMTDVYTVLPLDALVAIEHFSDRDILIVSWPPYDDEAVTECLKVWDKSVIYIGEGEGGCNAPYSFWNLWIEDATAPEIPLARWCGMHDRVYIGRRRNG